MPSSTLQARIAAFESGQPLRAPDSPPSPTTAALAKIPVIPPTPRAGSPAASAITPTPTVRVKPPPLPPRKPSLASLKSAASADSSNPPPLPVRSASDSLSVQHTYPPTKKGKHAQQPSASSFHSVSLSSDGGEQDDKDQDSQDGSFESVPSSIPTSTSIPSSPASETVSLNSLSSKGPKLPPRPSARTSTASLNSLPSAPSPSSLPSSPPTVGREASRSRRPAPPPPISSPRPREQAPTAYPPMHARNGHHSSSAHATKRPTPIPGAARARYDALFDHNIEQQRKTAKSKSQSQALRPPRRADGWRGLSIDWTGDADSLSGAPQTEERLRSPIVKQIWSWSRLPQETLKQIWNDVDSERSDGLTRDAFAKGMWKIDEELTRAATRKSARSPPRVPPKVGSIGRKAVPPLPSRNILY